MEPVREWLEADGLGGYAMGTNRGHPTRRYHGLLLTSTTPPTNRFLLVAGLCLELELRGVRHPLGHLPRREGEPPHIPPPGFRAEPWPTFTFAAPGGGRLVQETTVLRGRPTTVVTFRGEGLGPARLRVRPLLSGRDLHASHRENTAFRFEPSGSGGDLLWRPYRGVPGIRVRSNGPYRHDPTWIRGVFLAEEHARGQEALEDVASPGELAFDLSGADAMLVLQAEEFAPAIPDDLARFVDASRLGERQRRAGFRTPLERAADAYLVRRGGGKTIVAGYPWFTDWGRDTFIALRGLCLATGRLEDARQILTEWAGAVSQGMLPNRFPDTGDVPEFNSVDASLWYVVAVGDFLDAAARSRFPLAQADLVTLSGACEAILAGYSAGTRFGIHPDSDGLLAAGAPGLQLTWMDAKAGDWVVTPRRGKPVEIQALWINALAIGSRWSPRWLGPLARARDAFEKRFWDEARGHLHDVVDLDGIPGAVDSSFRPNQLFAIGGLPLQLLRGERARRLVDAAERLLWTPRGPRSLAPGEPGYRGSYRGGVLERDGAYHQGTVWPWLTGAFVEAWLRARGDSAQARDEARDRFIRPLMDHLPEAGIGHVSEVADGDAPHLPGGCPFQAWSVGELLRLQGLLASAGDAPPLAR